MNRAAWQALVSGPFRSAPGGMLLAMLTMAAGVALGVAVHLVNASAAGEFRRATMQLSGEADLVVRGSRAGFDEALYPRIAGLPGIAIASPVLELDATLGAGRGALRIMGLDPLRAWSLQPALAAGDRSAASDLFSADAIRLSASAAQSLGAAEGDALGFRSGNAAVRLQVAGILAEGAYRQPLGIMDIAAAQWRFGRTGTLNRIDLRLQPGADLRSVQKDLQALLPPDVKTYTPDTDSARGAELTRAYRLNLDMLAMIALFTGTFLVFSAQLLSVIRRRTQLALLRALGLTRREVLALLLAEGALIGAVGAAIGVAAGFLLARQLLGWSGADLGAGYFSLLQAELQLEPWPLLLYFGLGIVFAMAGAAVPAWSAARQPPARALHAGDADTGAAAGNAWKPGLAVLLAGIALLPMPPLSGVPLAGYAAIALLLLGSVMILPSAASRMLPHIRLRLPMPHALALARLQATSGPAAVSIAAILVSFSLVVAMLVMVSSFRNSLDDWLLRMLPADLYLRAAAAGETAHLPEDLQRQIAGLRGVSRTEFLRTRNLLLIEDRPPVTLIARDLPAAEAARTLPLVSPPQLPLPGAPPAAWPSELVADHLGLKTGQLFSFAIAGHMQTWTVAGIWRDYARQNGAVLIDRAHYRALSGDVLANDAAIWLAADAGADAVTLQLRAMLGHPATAEIASAGEIRRLSLAIFDRTFAITWALEAAALVVGLLGVALAFSAQALARQREFGVLRHLGMTRRDIGVMIAGEGAMTAMTGALCGLATGWVIGLILIHIINRQSFHWSMELATPWLALPALFCGIVLCAAAAAVMGARRAMARGAVAAVREDW